ncbi:MAG TPA: Hpt domain-containing protein [Bacteroidales bacterium]|jgi:HPt (histidine-containing phosphotransfer) domain-containing protein|nr:Hpt domain-containing protein [Bacteroidales bacterium]
MLYDLATLRNLSNNDEAFIVDMLQTFKRTSPPIMERMEKYISENKIEAVGREAHKMIPGVSFLGAKELQEVLIKIEESAKNASDNEYIHSMVTEAVRKVNELISCFENDFPGKL